MDKLILTQPDDWHLHLRDGEILNHVVSASARWCGRAIIMPNLTPPVTTVDMALAYRARILAALPKDTSFMPLMTLYLTEQTTPQDIAMAASQNIAGVKLYPAGATTNSESGVRDIEKVIPVLEAMAEYDLPLLIHGEVVDSDIDIFDREAVFIERHLIPLRHRLPTLRIVLEHITTAGGVDFVLNSDGRLAGTITPHHLIINRNHLLAGGLQAHYYCLPVAKRESHRLALLDAVLRDTGKLFLGTDSAPHADSAKFQPCGCAEIL